MQVRDDFKREMFQQKYKKNLVIKIFEKKLVKQNKGDCVK